ncbi:9955_t:CDS:2 [Funneliformis geosporum]|nr:9955_t:CDS:2 [Funneliformis geosporum]
MNPTNITITSQLNFEQVTESSNASSENMCHVTTTPQQENSMQSASSYQPFQTNSFGNSPIQIQPVHSNKFIYRPPNEHYQYHVSCEKISNDLIIKLLNLLKENGMQLKQNEYVFFYQQQCNDQVYQNMGQEQLAFTFDQEKNLELHLSQYLNNFFLN